MPPSQDNQNKIRTERRMSSKSEAFHSLGLQSSQTLDNSHGDEVMGLYLNQVSHFNAEELTMTEKMNQAATAGPGPPQLLTTHNHLTTLKIESTSHDMAHLSMADLHDTQRLEYDSIEPPEASPAPSGSKHEKAKSKESSSLLHSFVNPLLHAIPILARNCLNFEDFLAQTALQGQNELLGPKDEKDYADPHKLILDPTHEKSTMMPKTESPWQLRVLGLPASGAKSRVETQIKVCLQLIDASGNPSSQWSHLRLPEHLVAKEKLKRKHQKHVLDEKGSLSGSNVLSLEAAVVCEGNANNEILMCTSCVQREQKRLKRKRDNKVARASHKDTGATKVAALTASELPDLNDESVLAFERRKILLFNCNEYLEFNQGEATLPTRVTCYCRHHSEKIGFRLVFTIRDSGNNLIASGRSPPIMITDDHKSAKIQNASRKRVRTELDGGTPSSVEPAPSLKRKANPNTANGNADGETDSGVSSPVASTPATPISQTEDMPDSPPVKRQEEDVVRYRYPLAGSSSHAANGQHHPSPRPGSDAVSLDAPQLLRQQQQQPEQGLGHPHPQNQPTGLYEYLSTDSMHIPGHMATQLGPMPTVNNGVTSQHHQQQETYHQAHHPTHHQDGHQTRQQQQQHLYQHQSYLHPSNPLQATLARRRANVAQSCWPSSPNIYAKMQEKQTGEATNSAQSSPRVHRLIPAEGPIYGGSEVTVLGSNFYEGLTCLFGENPAVPTHCWSPNTLLCILPPAASAGPVVVSFKEHPLVLEGQDVALFTYFDESDRALMELALQVVGLKTLGKVEDARQIAMRIVQGDGGDRKSLGDIPFTNGYALDYRRYLTSAAAAAAYHNAKSTYLLRLEEQVMAALAAASDIEICSELDSISLTNRNRHTLLHLATLCGHVDLVRMLVKLGCDVNRVDHNGFTALHFASWTGKISIVKALVGKADINLRNKSGKTAGCLALEAGHTEVARFLRDRTQLPAVANIARLQPRTTPSAQPSIEPTQARNMQTQLSSMFSSFYSSFYAPCLQQITHSVGQVYSIMFDSF